MSGKSNSFYGIATIGTKGQIVIPADAREDMGLHPGDKVIIIGKHHPEKSFGMVCISPVGSAENFVQELLAIVDQTKSAIKQAKEDKSEEA